MRKLLKGLLITLTGVCLVGGGLYALDRFTDINVIDTVKDWVGIKKDDPTETKYDVEKSVVIDDINECKSEQWFIDGLNYGQSLKSYEIVENNYKDNFYKNGKIYSIIAKVTLTNNTTALIKFNVNLSMNLKNDLNIIGSDTIEISPYEYQNFDDCLRKNYRVIKTINNVYDQDYFVTSYDNFDMTKEGEYSIKLKYSGDEGDVSKTINIVVKRKTLTVKFVDGQDKVLKTYQVKEHDGVVYDGPKTFDGPTMTDDEQKRFKYVFKYWDVDLTCITADCTVKPVYDKVDILYTVKFLDNDGQVIETKKCKYEDSVTFDGEIPKKEGNDYFKYEFKSWNANLESIKSNVNVKPIYDEIRLQTRYLYVFDNITYGEEIVSAGNEPTYQTNTIPAKYNSDPRYNNKFSKWELGKLSKDRTTYTMNAVFEKERLKYRCTFYDYDGLVKEIKYIDVNEHSVVYSGETFEAPKHEDERFTNVFDCWNIDLNKIDFDADIRPYYKSVQVYSYVNFETPNPNYIPKELMKIGESYTEYGEKYLPKIGENFFSDTYKYYIENHDYYIATKLKNKGDDFIVGSDDVTIEFGYEYYCSAELLYNKTQNEKEVNVGGNIALQSEKVGIPSYTIDGKKIIGIVDSAFENNTFISEIEINNNFITSIPNNVFKGCENVTKITLNCESVVAIGYHAFEGIKEVEMINLKRMTKLKSIGEFAFLDCESLKAVIIYSTLYSKISVGTFKNCFKLKTLTNENILENDNYEKETELNLWGNIKEIQDNAFENCKSIKIISVISTTLIVGSKIVYGCTDITINFKKIQKVYINAISKQEDSFYVSDSKNCNLIYYDPNIIEI